MELEHRVGFGHTGGFEVHIRYGRRRLHSAYGHDPSSAGLRLELRAVTLPEGTPVQLEIQALGRRWLVPAVVTCRDRRTIAVRFLEPQPDLAADLTRVAALPPPGSVRARVRLPLLNRASH
jgi:hypothetical protein